MTTRISENQALRSLVNGIQINRQSVDKYSKEISSGIAVAEPGDSTFSGTISQLRSLTERLDAYQRRTDYVEGYFTLQDDILNQTTDLLVRAKEIATQASNETNGENERLAVAAEVFQLRDHLISLANTKYQGQYVYSGDSSDAPAYSRTDDYAAGDGASLIRYEYAGGTGERSANLTESLSITLNTPGNEVFDQALWALERLGRALQGYDTQPALDPEDAAFEEPDGSGAAYSLPADFDHQTQDILDCIGLLDKARETVINPERVDVAGRLRRLETAQSLLKLNSASSKEVLSKLQDADLVESATNLSMAEQALNASMSVTAKVLNLSILNYL